MAMSLLLHRAQAHSPERHSGKDFKNNFSAIKFAYPLMSSRYSSAEDSEVSFVWNSPKRSLTII